MNLVSDASTAAPHWELFEALCAALCRGVLAPPAAPAIASIELWVMRQASPATAAECARGADHAGGVAPIRVELRVCRPSS